jgi:ribosome-binding protein aMBF1 (putative translation factor)
MTIPNRTIKQVKALNFSFGSVYCHMCGKNLREQGSIYAVDSRNDKYCPKCAVQFLNQKIENLNKLKQEVRDKSMLNELEEPEENEEDE